MISPSEMFTPAQDLISPGQFFSSAEQVEVHPEDLFSSEADDDMEGKFEKCKEVPVPVYNRNKRNKNLVEGKKRKRKANQNGVKKNVEMLNGNMIKHSATVCTKCNCQKSRCAWVNFPIIQTLREDVYGEGSTRATRAVWRHEYLQEVFDKTKVEKAKASVTFDEKLLNYFVPAKYTPTGKDIPVCRRCMEEVTGFSSATIQDTRKQVVEGVKVDLSSVGEKPKLKTPEWRMTVAWIEMHITSLTCYSPEGRKQELQGGMTLKHMHQVFKDDWAAGVMAGVYHRSNYGRMAKEKRDHKEAPSYSFFAKVWQKEFNCEYKIPRHHKRFPMCNWCCQIKTFLEKAKTPEEKLHWRSELLGHFMFIENCKGKYYSHREKAEKNKSK